MCHKHGLMHRNLKTENFLCAHKKETAYLKLTDFRSSIFFKPGNAFLIVIESFDVVAGSLIFHHFVPSDHVQLAEVCHSLQVKD
jgi:serine/threonine protein kinase